MWSMRVGKRQLAEDVRFQLQQLLFGGTLTSVQVPRPVHQRDNDPVLFRRSLGASGDKLRLAVGEPGPSEEV